MKTTQPNNKDLISTLPIYEICNGSSTARMDATGQAGLCYISEPGGKIIGILTHAAYTSDLGFSHFDCRETTSISDLRDNYKKYKNLDGPTTVTVKGRNDKYSFIPCKALERKWFAIQCALPTKTLLDVSKTFGLPVLPHIIESVFKPIGIGYCEEIGFFLQKSKLDTHIKSIPKALVAVIEDIGHPLAIVDTINYSNGNYALVTEYYVASKKLATPKVLNIADKAKNCQTYNPSTGVEPPEFLPSTLKVYDQTSNTEHALLLLDPLFDLSFLSLPGLFKLPAITETGKPSAPEKLATKDPIAGILKLAEIFERSAQKKLTPFVLHNGTSETTIMTATRNENLVALLKVMQLGQKQTLHFGASPILGQQTLSDLSNQLQTGIGRTLFRTQFARLPALRDKQTTKNNISRIFSELTEMTDTSANDPLIFDMGDGCYLLNKKMSEIAQLIVRQLGSHLDSPTPGAAITAALSIGAKLDTLQTNEDDDDGSIVVLPRARNLMLA